MEYAPDHPSIRNCEQTGYPDGKEPKNPICPECNEECSIIYKNDMNKIVGCDICIIRKNVEDENISCPICAENLIETLYKTTDNEIVGCEHCISKIDAWDNMDKNFYE